MDDLCDTCGSLAVGAGERSHDWWIYSYFACHRNRCGADQNHSGTQTVLTVGIKEGKAVVKGGENKKRNFLIMVSL